MATTRSAHTVWAGDLASGTGTTSLDTSGVASFDVTWKSRSEDAQGKTSPEELIAAAHSACFSMAFSHALGEAGFTPEQINTTAEVGFDHTAGGITGIKLTTQAKVPGIDNAQFQEIAEAAKNGCPVSAALAGTSITLDATLEA